MRDHCMECFRGGYRKYLVLLSPEDQRGSRNAGELFAILRRECVKHDAHTVQQMPTFFYYIHRKINLEAHPYAEFFLPQIANALDHEVSVEKRAQQILAHACGVNHDQPADPRAPCGKAQPDASAVGMTDDEERGASQVVQKMREKLRIRAEIPHCRRHV